MLENHPTSDILSNTSKRDRRELQRLVDYSQAQSLPEIWHILQQRFGNVTALHDPHAKPEIVLTYTQLYQQIQQFAASLQALGVQAGERISLFADNCPQWMIADQGIMMAGAVDAVRSSAAERQELLYILENSGSTALVVENLKTLNELRPELNSLPIKFVILLSQEQPPAAETVQVLNFSQLMAKGANYTFQPVKQSRDTLATLLYTSGTTGKPKGVMLSHGNLLHQVNALAGVVQPNPGDIALSILPTWHCYERSCEYFLLAQGCTQVYTNLRSVKQDLKQFKPHYMVGVPRLWESIYEGVQKQFREQQANKQRLINTLLTISQKYVLARRTVQGLNLENLHPSLVDKLIARIKTIFLSPLHALGKKLVYNKVREATGGRIKQVISGGGSLAMHLENFFEIIGVQILVGYGLTETSPVTNARRPWRCLRGSSGQPVLDTEVKIVDLDTRKPLPTGQRGLVLLRGPQIMQGYYRNPEATKKAIDAEGWFDSGDIGWVTDANDLVLTGRAKDTIVLTNGENIEPQPIEDACLRSPYIDQIMLVGQDQRYLGALIVPNLEALQKWAESKNLYLALPNDSVATATGEEITLESKIIQDLLKEELNREVQNRPGYRPDDRIVRLRIILEPFSMENGLMTQTLKIRRHVVMEHYHDIINGMFA